MKKKILLTLLFLSVFGLTSCEGLNKIDGFDSHTHTFEETWTTDALKHWHNASCTHTEFTKDLGNHTFNEEGFCTVCNFETLEHFKTFTFNGTNCTCSTLEQYHLTDTITLTISPDENYLLPKTITTTGLEDYTYDKETGIITGKIVDDIVITAETYRTNKVYYLSKIEAVTSYGDSVTRTYEYDTTNNSVKIITYMNGNLDDNTIDIFTYNDNHQIIKEEYGSNNVIHTIDEMEYSSNGNKIAEYNYILESEEKNLINKTTYEYDDQNRVSVEKKYSYVEGVETYTKFYTFEYFDGYNIEKRYDAETEPASLYRIYKNIEIIDEEHNTLTESRYEVLIDSTEEIFDGGSIYDLRRNILIGQILDGITMTTKVNSDNDPTEVEVKLDNGDDVQMTFPIITYQYNEEGYLTSFVMNDPINIDSFTKIIDATFEHDNQDFITKANLRAYDGFNSSGYVTFEYTSLEPGTYVPFELKMAYTNGNYLGLFGMDDSLYQFAITPEYID